MKLHHLRNLVAVADANSIRGAARAQGLAQPAITRGLRDLEKELGVPLLERHGKGVSLNAYGESFVVRARSVLRDVERGREEIAQLKGGADMGRGRVNAGLSSAVVGGMLSATGYLAGQPEQPAGALWGIAALMGPITGVIAVLIAAVLGWGYPMGRAEVARLRDDLAARRAAAAALPAAS